MAKQIAKTYGDALFDAALERGTLDAVSREAEAVLQIVADYPDLKKLLCHPNIVKEEKLEIIRNIFAGRVSEEMFGFLCVLTEKDRQAYLEAILTCFSDRVKAYRKTGVVQVISAHPLNGGQKKKIERKILDSGGYRSLETHYSVDGSLIGGVVIRIGDRVADGSVRGRLDRLTRQLRGAQDQG